MISRLPLQRFLRVDSLRSFLVANIVLLAFALLMAGTSSSYAQHLVANPKAARLGLHRAWFAQVRVDPTQQKVLQWVLDNDRLFALASDGTVQAIHTETGEILWTTEGAGQPHAIGIAANSKYVAMLGASRLYLLDRTDGQILWTRQIGGPTCAAPALSETHAFVALINGRIEGYPLDKPTTYAWQYQSHGHTFECPTVTGKILSWPSDRGVLYVAQTDGPRVKFRVAANDEIVVPPAEQAPYLYVGSLDGYFYCFHETSGSERWRYATGFAITSPPAVIGNKAFVASEDATLHAVDATTGKLLWQADGVTKFVALGKHHTYGMDRYGALMVLDNETGVLAGRLSIAAGSSALVNDKSDRIFLINDHGLVQCLHEVDAHAPTWHRAAKTKPTEAEQAPEGSAPKEVDSEEAEDSPLRSYEEESTDPEDSEDNFGDFAEADPFE